MSSFSPEGAPHRPRSFIASSSAAKGTSWIHGSGLTSILATAAIGFMVGASLVLLGPTFVDARDDDVYEVINSDNAGKQRPSLLGRFFEAHPNVKTNAASLPPPLPPSSALRALATKSGQTQKASIDLNSSRRTVCVRMCDGYHFPIGDLDKNSDLPAHEAMCQSACPGATVKLFTLREGEDQISKAVMASAKSYASLPMAYAYQSTRDSTCTCQAQPGRGARISPLRDLTLRKGDTVVLNGKAKVFMGASRFPYRLSDFRDFRDAEALPSRAQRRQIDAVLGISRREAELRSFRLARRLREARGPAIGLMPASETFTSLSPVGNASIRVVNPAMY